MPKGKFPILGSLVQGRFRGPEAINDLLHKPISSRGSIKSFRRRPAKQKPYLRGVYKGNFFRLPVPTEKAAAPFRVPKLPPSTPMPQALKPLPPAKKTASGARAEESTTAASKIIEGSGHPKDESSTALAAAAATVSQSGSSQGASGSTASFASRLWQWWLENWPVLVLNFGSICTLTGFTRSDILELRSLSVTGSVTFIIYSLTRSPIQMATISWSALFASVNLFKIFGIIQERNAKVHFSEEEKLIYENHFLSHGITPKQFEKIYQHATIKRVRENEHIIDKGEKMTHLYLVVQGETRAHNLFGRRLTAASTTSETKGDRKEGGDSGAWIGEMAFLDQFWQKENPAIRKKTAYPPEAVATTGPASPSGKDIGGSIAVPTSRKQQMDLAYVTIVAKEDVVMLQWSHEDMEALMASSSDMRSALTRAMTAAVVGKVVNLTVSRPRPKWYSWIEDILPTSTSSSQQQQQTMAIKAALRPGGTLAEDKRSSSSSPDNSGGNINPQVAPK